MAKALGVTLPFAHQVIRGRRLLPLDKVSAWADALGLKGAARVEFEFRVQLEHAPDGLTATVEQMQKRIADLEAEVTRLKTRTAKSAAGRKKR